MSASTADPDALTPDQQFDQLVDDDPVFTEHAIDRWVERVCSVYDGVAPWDLEAAFERALPVDILGTPGSGRLHSPTRSIIVFKRDYSSGPPVLVTVLTLGMQPIDDSHLKTCEDCGLRYRDDGDDECGWCPEAAERVEWGMEVEHGH